MYVGTYIRTDILDKNNGHTFHYLAQKLSYDNILLLCHFFLNCLLDLLSLYKKDSS